MKELRTVLTLQITFIEKFSDEDADWQLATRKEREKRWVEQLKEESLADDVLVLDSKLFVAEVEESHES